MMNPQKHLASEDQYRLARALCESLDLAFIVVDSNGGIHHLNHAALQLFAIEENESDAVPEFLAALVTAASGDFSLTLAAPDGERHYLATFKPAESTANGGLGFITFQDQTEQVHLARKLIESEDRLRAIGQAALDAIVIIDMNCKVLFANPTTSKLLHWSATDSLECPLCTLLGRKRFLELAFPQSSSDTVDERTQRLEVSSTRADGSQIELELSLNQFHASRGRAVLVIIRDISARKQRERALEEAESRWQFALEGNGDAVWDWDLEEDSILFGPNFKSMLGYTEHELADDYRAWESCIHPDDLPRVRAQLDAYISGRADKYVCEMRMRQADGTYMWIQDRGLIVARDGSGKPLRMVGTQRDITESIHATESMQQQLVETLELNQQLEEAQLQLVQSEKLAVIGQLAAGVAHEMNTPLGFVSSNLNTLERYAKELLDLVHTMHVEVSALNPRPELAATDALAASIDLDFIQEDLPALLGETREGLDRVLSIVRDLRDFSRAGEQQWQSTDLHSGLDSTLNILHNQLKHHVKVIREYGTLPTVWCVPSQINQVFLNLLNNAAQAIEQQGTITVRTHSEGSYAIVEIEDSGCGMSETQLSHIFEPFYTTKPAGKGTGLGLSLSLDIVRKHQGSLTAASRPGVGSTFTLKLPLNNEPGSTAD